MQDASLAVVLHRYEGIPGLVAGDSARTVVRLDVLDKVFHFERAEQLDHVPVRFASAGLGECHRLADRKTVARVIHGLVFIDRSLSRRVERQRIVGRLRHQEVERTDVE